MKDKKEMSKSKIFILGAFLGAAIPVIINMIVSANRSPIPNYYEPLSDTMGRVKEYYDGMLSSRDIEIEELRIELANRPVKTKVKTVVVFEEYESNPDAEVSQMDGGIFRVDWTDPLACGWLQFDGPSLINNSITETYLKIYEQPLNIEIVEMEEGEWYIGIEDEIEEFDLFTVSDLSVTSLPEDNIFVMPGVSLIGGEEGSGIHLGGTLYTNIYGVELLGDYSRDEWRAYAGYRFNSGFGMGVGASDSDIRFGVSFLFGF